MPTRPAANDKAATIARRLADQVLCEGSRSTNIGTNRGLKNDGLGTNRLEHQPSYFTTTWNT